MKTTFPGWFALLLAALLVTSSITRAATPASAGPEAAVRILDNQERLAVLAGDTAALERLWAPTMIVNNPQSTISADRSVVLGLVKQGRIKYATFERTIEAIRLDGDLAIVMGAEMVVPVGEAPRAGQTIHRRFTNLWKQQGTSWVIVARHANVIPPK